MLQSAGHHLHDPPARGERVHLGFDVERIDPYGRTLAYVWVGERLINHQLVERGFAVVTTFPQM